MNSRNKITFKRRVDLKNILAVLVIIASFLVALALAIISNNRSNYWIATRDLTPGHQIVSEDFKVAKAALSNESRGYLLASQNPLGYAITKFIAAGEYLHQSALAESELAEDVKLISFAAAAPDLPTAIQIGDTVNLYQVINDNGDGISIPSQLVIEEVFVVDINRKSENIGGISIVTVAIPNEFVERALNATRKGRLVVVANHG